MGLKFTLFYRQSLPPFLVTNATSHRLSGGQRPSAIPSSPAVRRQVSSPRLGTPRYSSLASLIRSPPGSSLGSDVDCPNPNPKRGEVPVVCPSDDALVEILSRLPAKPRFRFKCVSKPWCDLITNRLRCRKFPQTLEGFFFGGIDYESYEHFVDLSGRPSPLVDASFSFLTGLPEIEKISLLGSCNGLVLFGHRRVSDMNDSLGYIVCNPATEQWVAVPSSGWTPSPLDDLACTYLIFDPTVSSHFQLVQFMQDDQRGILQFRRNAAADGDDEGVAEVRTYSSETGVWSGRTISKWSTQGWTLSYSGSVFVNGMLHVMVVHEYEREAHIVVVDREGKKCRSMCWPVKRGEIVFVGQSQGHLHCISVHTNSTVEMAELSLWVLEDYNAEEWVLKHRVSFAHMSGKFGQSAFYNCYFVSIHQDRNMVFFVMSDSGKLMSYDMDSKEVCVLCTVGCDYAYVTQYVPYFSESPALSKKH